MAPQTRGQNRSLHQSFHHFARLPNELQAMIWQYTLPGPLIYYPKTLPRVPGRSNVFKYPPVPTAFQVCRLSRYVTGRNMKKFRLGSSNVPVDNDSEPYGYCCPVLDILVVDARLYYRLDRNFGTHPFLAVAFIISPNWYPGDSEILPMTHLATKIIFATYERIKGFESHCSCSKDIPVGLPKYFKMGDIIRMTGLEDIWSSKIPQQVAERNLCVPTLYGAMIPMACECPGVRKRMGHRVQMINDAKSRKGRLRKKTA
ncbi:hypothetical protein NOF04DRAFT_21575 [Fusarium oxysporum II5]|uniref:2EXR domain-containing protein n=2 Tax=Fusarium oxysporum species complex TaxID=171631 RepID=X0JZH7_FUSO5|nr:uncharacterized protein FOIG_16495 [Fusarium odoratissimum NRRL 54006]EXL90254.1 hypothetical protein FOIG_16495 [Fusarium odoratissimum NRRL 54006]KAK2134243.1 hypothetical protein NOF04DRAFT_21575 [Fusarium oxysporum II5]TXB97019.1 hypothetical protein FocTR4_00012173 [Fusarium oxysporum f. sp. cubense]